jgi:inosose dehydratase
MFLRSALGAPLALAAAKNTDPVIGLGIGTYGMKSMAIGAALSAIAETGYDGVELALMPGWPTEPKLLSPSDRQDLRKQLGRLGLALPSLLESLPLVGTPEKRAANLERLKQGMALAHELAPSQAPVIETILGGKTADWDNVKDRMVDELKDWAKLAESNKITICFKPHAGQAVHTPERALWLIHAVGSPNFRIVYDYSHFSLEGVPLEASLKECLPYTPFIHVKDSAGTPDKHDYLLPGDGKTDYVAYFKLLKQYGYQGFVVVEISSMVFSKPGYRPLPAVRLCYERLAPAFAKAGVKRPPRAG